MSYSALDVHSARMPAAPSDASAVDLTSDFALADLDRRFRRPLIAYFRRRVPSATEAEDLTQDAFERVLISLKRGPILNAEALVFRIAVNLLRDRARRERRHTVEETLAPETIAELADELAMGLSAERVVLGEHSLAEVLNGLDRLGERTRAMFYLHRIDGLRIHEIAELYGISPSAVEKHVTKALLHLTRWLYR